MIPIRELFNRIRWDEQFAKGEFRIGYYDRIGDRIIHVDFRELVFEPDEHLTFTLVDTMGTIHRVPLHRVKEVYHNGELIWRRPH